ncbi:MAG TPA: cupin domain-containing protein [Tissierellia bacterium]|nr:cupin domain-containing protein [Tissierellia bacterium]
MLLGEKVRNLRLMMGLTQEELAERSNLTKGFISQLENSMTSPSVDTMEGIVAALGSTMSDFFKEDQTKPVVYSVDESFSALYEQLGLQIHWIVPSAQTNTMEPTVMELQPGGRSKTYNPFEGESFGYVISGTIHLILGHEEYQVSTGNCFYFDADRVFQVENRSDSPAKLLWVLTPPNF